MWCMAANLVTSVVDALVELLLDAMVEMLLQSVQISFSSVVL